MAEIFSAVSSGAGLVSLSMQLIESTQKLKRFYDASREAPNTIADLCFELETMALSLRQLEHHRTTEILVDEPLGRCVATCTRMIIRIQRAVGKIERLLSRSQIAGRLYMAFKEPEIGRLLGEMENAKSSMSFAYMSYCHSCNVGQAMKHAAASGAQNAILSSHAVQLQRLECNVQTGNAEILACLHALQDRDRSKVSPSVASDATRIEQLRKRLQIEKKRPVRTFRVSLPFWFIGDIWDFAFWESVRGWEARLCPVNLRSRDSFAFDVVCSGNVAAVRSLLASGELSVRDRFPHHAPRVGAAQNALELAATHGHVELCEFLLDEIACFGEDMMMNSALQAFISYSACRHPSPPSYFSKVRRESDQFYQLFINKHGMLPSIGGVSPTGSLDEDVTSNKLLTETAIREVLQGQLIPFSSIPLDLDLGFEFVMGSTGWPAESFLGFTRVYEPLQLVTKTDSRGRTALHWAAEHLGYWMITYLLRDEAPDDSQVQGYAALAEKLIAMGADVHAISADGNTPLQSVLEQADPYRKLIDCAHILKQWEDIIVQTNRPLACYIDAEKKIQQRMGRIPHPFPDFLCNKVRLEKIEPFLSQNSTLAIRRIFCRRIEVRKYSPPPGTWAADSQASQTISWNPWNPRYREGPEGNHRLWPIVKEIEIFSAPYVLQQEDSPHRHAFDRHELRRHWRGVFLAAHDDIGPAARVLQHHWKGKRHAVGASRRRSTSAPPPVAHKIHCPPSDEIENVLTTTISTASLHKCVLDAKWKPYSTIINAEDFRRYCMEGRCSSPWSYDFEMRRHWESELVRDTDNYDTAMRYADRFHPELESIFKIGFEKKRRWKEFE